MQVTSTNNLTWIQSANAAAAQTSPAGSTGGQDLLDASGAEGGSPSSMLASLQSPSQLFSSANLSALISAQAGQSTTDLTQSAAGAAQDGSDLNSTTPVQPPLAGGSVQPHRHHRHGGGDAVDPSTAQTSNTEPTSTAAESASSAAGSVQASMSQLLASFI